MYFPSHGPFLSTPSARRATLLGRDRRVHDSISIHALREEGDALQAHVSKAQCNFYPRPPRGGRQKLLYFTDTYYLFLSTPSARRATPHRDPWRRAGSNFYPRPPRGGRLCSRKSWKLTDLFLSTPSARRATAKTETKSLFSYKLYNILHEFRRALIYNGSKSYPNHAK